MFSSGQTPQAPREPAQPVPQETETARVEIALPPRVKPAAAVIDELVEVSDAPDAATAKTGAPRTDAKTVEGSARSVNGATSPWLLLPAERNYRMYVPAHVSSRNDGDVLPLVVMIHGCRETAEAFEQGTRMNAIADREGFAVLYPDQATFANVRRCWNWFERNTAAGNGECAIILEMIREARKRAPLDRSRVCVAGMSSGGAIAGLLAYHHPNVFAAAAVHSGLPPMLQPSATAAISALKKGVRIDTKFLSERYWSTHEVLPPALMVLHGDDDETVTAKNATLMVRLWETLFDSAPQADPLTRVTTDIESADHARSYSKIDQLREGQVVISGLRIHGLDHAWSGGDAALPFNDAKGPDASELIWRFFERQRRAV